MRNAERWGWSKIVKSLLIQPDQLTEKYVTLFDPFFTNLIRSLQSISKFWGTSIKYVRVYSLSHFFHPLLPFHMWFCIEESSNFDPYPLHLNEYFMDVPSPQTSFKLECENKERQVLIKLLNARTTFHILRSKKIICWWKKMISVFLNIKIKCFSFHYDHVNHLILLMTN